MKSMSTEADDVAASPVLVAFLADRDMPCPLCGYNLRAVRSPRCAECGARIELRVQSDDLRLGPWIAAIVGASVPEGFLIAAGVVGAISAARGEFVFLREWVVAAFCWSSMLVLGGVIAVLTANRRALWQLARRTQWLLAMGTAGLGFALMGSLIWLFIVRVGA
jgi:hypothetical protein